VIVKLSEISLLFGVSKLVEFKQSMMSLKPLFLKKRKLLVLMQWREDSTNFIICSFCLSAFEDLKKKKLSKSFEIFVISYRFSYN
jgi:hypothetical protein